MCFKTAARLLRLDRTAGLILMLLGTPCVTGCSGFASLQDLHYSWTNKSRAHAAWLSSTTAAERRELGGDYGDGFKKGFYDASTGRGCKLPAVPPPCYWSPKYQSCEGQVCIQNWYRGYQCGVTAAQGQGFPAFHKIPVGPCAPRTNSSGCQGCYSPDYCECTQCGGACATGQCSQGVHPDAPDQPGLIYGPSMETESLEAPAPVAPLTSTWSGGIEANGTGAGMVRQTAFVASYEEMFPQAVGGQ